MVIKGNWNDPNRITSTSYRQNDRELPRIYANVNSLNARNFDFAPTGFSAEYAQRMQEASDKILNIYAGKEGGEGTNALERFAIDAAIAYGLNIDIEEASRNHDRFIGMFTGENLEDKSFVEAFGDMWETYGIQKRIADLQNDFDDSDDEEERKQLNLEMQELEREMIKHQDYSDRSWLGNNVIQAAPIANQIVRSLAWTVGGSLVGASIAGIASGAMTGISAAGNISKGVGMLKATLASRAVQTGAIWGARAGDAANAIINVYGVEKGSFSRQLYNLVDANGQRLSDEMRDMYSRMYALIATAIEFATPEPGISTLLRSPAAKTLIGNSVKDTIFRIGMNAAGGAISESFEEMLQNTIQTASQDLAQYFANQRGENNFEIGPLSGTIARSISAGIEAFNQTLIPSMLIGGISGGGVALTQLGTRDLIRNYSPATAPSPEEQKAAESRQERNSNSVAVNIHSIKMKRESPSRDYNAPVQNADGTTSGPQKAPVINVRNNGRTGRLEPISETDADVAKYLLDTGAKTAFVNIQQDDLVVASEDLENSAAQHNGFYDSDTNAIYVSSKEDSEAVRNEIGGAVIRTESVDSMTDRITYRNTEGEEVSVDIIADPTLSDVLAESVDSDTNTDTVYNETVDNSVTEESIQTEIDSWSARGSEWYSTGEFTRDLGSLIRRSPENAGAVLRAGLSSYLRNVNPSMTEEQISAMADANAVLMENLARAQGRTTADFVGGLTGLGVTNDPSLRGQYREENGARSIVLNPETMSPTTFSHEVGHYFLMTLPDGPVKDRIINTYRAEYEADGNTIGEHLHEAFVNGLTEYQTSGVAQNTEIRGIFQRLINAMKSFISRLKKSGGLSAEQIALYDSFFNQEFDSDVSVVSSQELQYASTGTEAKKILNAIKGKEITNKNDGTVARVGSTGINKMVSNAAREKSVNNGFSNEEHFTAAANVVTLFENGELIEERPDRNNTPDLMIRYYATPVEFGDSGKQAVAKTMVKINTNQANTIYTVELDSLEGIEKFKSGPLVSASNTAQHRHPDSIIKLPSETESVNSEGITLNETVDDETLSPEQIALRERIRRGRRAQGARRTRFFQNIDSMIDSDLFVEASDLVSYRGSIEEEIRNRIKNGEEGLKFSDDSRWTKLTNELAMRDKMLLYPKEYAGIARDGRTKAQFVQYVKDHTSGQFTDEMARVAEKYYGYANTPDPRVQMQMFVDEYSDLNSLLALKVILGPRRVASRSRSGNVFTRLYVPTSNVYQEIKNLTRNSTREEVEAVRKSIRQNPAEWYQAYLSSLISGARTGRRTAEETQTDLEAIAMSYYAGKNGFGQDALFEKMNSRTSESQKDIRKASDTLDSSSEGRTARKMKRSYIFSDQYIERIVPKTQAEIELEKARAKAREAIGRSERAIRRMSNISISDTDARFVPVAQWLYAFMHGGRNTVFTEAVGTDVNRYQDILEGKASPEDGDTDYTFYPNIETASDGEIYIVRNYSDEIENVSGTIANLGGFRFDKNAIPEDLAENLPQATIDNIRSVNSWNELSSEDITNIATAFRMAKQKANDIQLEKKRQRIARDKEKSLSVARRILRAELHFTPEQLHDVGYTGLKLQRDATEEEAWDFYRHNPSRLLELYDSDIYDSKADRTKKKFKDNLLNFRLGYEKMQRFTRALDGEENGPIFNAFVRDIFEGYQDMLREIQRREDSAKKAFAPIIGDTSNRSLTREQRRAERAKMDSFLEMMGKVVTLKASSDFANERNTRRLNGYDLLQVYLNAKNINGFKKLIDVKGSGLSLEALLDYVPDEVREFVDLELRIREEVVKERNRINTEWNESQIRKMESDPSYTPDYRETNLTWEEIPDDFKGKSFIDRSTQDLERILKESEGRTSKLDERIIKIGDVMMQQLADERQRVIDADYKQTNRLMVIERNYWPLVDRRRSIGASLNLTTPQSGSRAFHYRSTGEIHQSWRTAEADGFYVELSCWKSRRCYRCETRP